LNIDDFRRIKAEELESAKNPVEPVVPDVVVPPVVNTPVVPEVTAPEKFMVNGQEVTMEELQNGYLRQGDYTKKTQEVAKQRGESQEAIDFYETLKQNPQLVEELRTKTPLPQSIDPVTAKVTELENKLYEMMLQSEVEGLKNKYPDFEVREVIERAQKEGITNLESAYRLVKAERPAPVVDADEARKTMRASILAEIQAEGASVSTLITGNDATAVVPDTTVSISDQEQKVAKGMKMSESEYVKWRDIGKKK